MISLGFTINLVLKLRKTIIVQVEVGFIYDILYIY